MPTKLGNLPDLYSEQEVAKYLGCHITTLKAKRRAGEISHVHVGGKIRFREEDLRAYLDQQTRRPEKAKPESPAEPRQPNSPPPDFDACAAARRILNRPKAARKTRDRNA